MKRWRAGLLALMAATAVAAGCSKLRTTGALRALNAPAAPANPGEDPPVAVSQRTRIARLTKAQLADSYLDPQRVGGWLAALGARPKPLVDLSRCLVDVKAAGAQAVKGPDACYDEFMEAVSPGLPGAPDVAHLKTLANPEAGRELDVERFLANARALASSLASFEQIVGRGPLPEEDLVGGLADGTRRAAAYVQARSWRRSVTRPSSAIVISGGGSTGAFSAGLVWRLLEVLQSCRAARAGGCPGANIDLAVGTSTGALISTVIDVASTPGHETKGRDLLVDAYTCSVNSRLYCVQDEWIWELATSDVKGLVRFDGVRELMRANVPQSAAANGTELVAVSVDFESGDIYGESDQDPEDAGDWEHRQEAIMASIVIPVMAQPVSEIARDGGVQRGTFLDGGVRSGLPVLEAVRRGADRVLVVNSGGIEPGRQTPPKNAFKILMRTIDLLSGQPRPGEIQQGELEAVERRFTEYNVCKERLAGIARTSPVDVEDFCRRSKLFTRRETAMEAAAPTFVGPAFFEQVATSWRSSWVFRPEEPIATSESYAFDPATMRGLFELGARTFQRRCAEILDLFAIEGEVARSSCKIGEEDVVARARELYKPLDQCGADRAAELRTCP